MNANSVEITSDNMLVLCSIRHRETAAPVTVSEITSDNVLLLCSSWHRETAALVTVSEITSDNVLVLCSSRHRETAAPVTASFLPDELSVQASSCVCSSSQLYRQLCLLPHKTHHSARDAGV